MSSNPFSGSILTQWFPGPLSSWGSRVKLEVDQLQFYMSVPDL